MTADAWRKKEKRKNEIRALSFGYCLLCREACLVPQVIHILSLFYKWDFFFSSHLFVVTSIRDSVHFICYVVQVFSRWLKLSILEFLWSFLCFKFFAFYFLLLLLPMLLLSPYFYHINCFFRLISFINIILLCSLNIADSPKSIPLDLCLSKNVMVFDHLLTLQVYTRP